MKKSTPSQPKSSSEKKDKGMFLTFKTGLQSFVDAIEKKLEPNSVIKGVRITGIDKNADGYELELDGGEILLADSVVISVPHHVTQSMLKQHRFFDASDSKPAFFNSKPSHRKASYKFGKQ